VISALPRVALLASPLLGAAVWRPAATALTDRGWDVLVVPGLAQAPRHPAQVLAHLLDALPDGPALALVAHSNAGLYLPALAAERRVAASVYADAALPAAVGASSVASPRMHRFLQDLTDDDGLLPPWTQWWDEEQVAALFPDADCRAAVAAEQHRLPIEYFTASINAPAGWTERQRPIWPLATPITPSEIRLRVGGGRYGRCPVGTCTRWSLPRGWPPRSMICCASSWTRRRRRARRPPLARESAAPQWWTLGELRPSPARRLTSPLGQTAR